jgi:hypothetical protein
VTSSEQRRARPIPGSPPSPLSQDIALWNGECPICSARVLWAFDRTDRADGSRWYAPLDLDIREPELSTSEVFVLMSSTGQASAIAPVVHRKHVCPPDVVQELLRNIGALGYYTAEVLAVGCPIRPCGSAPGMLCLTQRREAQPRPHGARVVLSRGEELEDPTF